MLAEIGSLATFHRLAAAVELLPREEEDVKAESGLTQATNQFIREHLGPRVRQLAARTRAIVQAELSSHFRDAADLIVAVSQSERVRTIESLAWPVSLNPVRGATEHAQGALQAWAAVDKLEKTPGSAGVPPALSKRTSDLQMILIFTMPPTPRPPTLYENKEFRKKSFSILKPC